MKKILLLLLSVVGLSFAVQAIPAFDRDIGCVSYVMPAIQVNTVSGFALVPVVVRPAILCEYSMDRIPRMQADTEQTEQCTISVISPPSYSQLYTICITNLIFKTSQCLLPATLPYRGPIRVAQVNDNRHYTGANFS
jgi:hypothetical protein